MSKKKYSDSKTNKKRISKPHKKEVLKQKNKEIWKPFPIKKHKKKYHISNHGRVKNILTGNILQWTLRSRYQSICYISDGVKEHYKTHRMVALAFIHNDDPETKKCVNHINGDRQDNRVENLEWRSTSENNKHAIDTGLSSKTIRGVIRYDPTEKNSPDDIKIYDSVLEASRDIDVNDGGICSACVSKNSYYCGYYWHYADENPNCTTDINLSEYKQIDGYPGYLINREGKIYSFFTKRFLRIGDHTGGSGAQIQISNTGKGKDLLMHRLVGQYFLKKTNPKHNSIRYIDGDKTNCHVDNLKWCYVGGVEMLKSKYETPYCNSKTTIKLPKRKKHDNEDPLDLLNRIRKNLSKQQRVEFDVLTEAKKNGQDLKVVIKAINKMKEQSGWKNKEDYDNMIKEMKKNDESEEELEEELEEESEEKPKKKTIKKNIEDESEEKPKKKVNKKIVEEESESEEQPKKKSTKKINKKIVEEESESEEKPKKKINKKIVEEESESESEEKPKKKPTKKINKKIVEEESESEEQPKKKSTKSALVKKLKQSQ